MRWSFRTDLIEPNTRKSWKEWTDTVSHIFLHELRAMPSCYGMSLLLPCKLPCKYLSLSASGNFLTHTHTLTNIWVHMHTHIKTAVCTHTYTLHTAVHTDTRILTQTYTHTCSLTDTSFSLCLPWYFQLCWAFGIVPHSFYLARLTAFQSTIY